MNEPMTKRERIANGVMLKLIETQIATCGNSVEQFNPIITIAESAVKQADALLLCLDETKPMNQSVETINRRGVVIGSVQWGPSMREIEEAISILESWRGANSAWDDEIGTQHDRVLKLLRGAALRQ